MALGHAVRAAIALDIFQRHRHKPYPACLVARDALKAAWILALVLGQWLAQGYPVRPMYFTIFGFFQEHEPNNENHPASKISSTC